MRVRTVRPHRNDHENDQGKPGWKHTGTEYEHPDPAEDIKRGLIEPSGEVASGEEPVAADDEPEPEPEPEPDQTPSPPPSHPTRKVTTGKRTKGKASPKAAK